MSPRTDYGSLFLSSGGLIIGGAAICLVIGTIGLGGFIAALLAGYVALVIVNSLDRADKRSWQ
jgi:hypothetical protein